jgi:hypothetical protein
MHFLARTLLLLSMLSALALAQPSGRVTFLPGELATPPLTASYQEPRVGLRKEFATSRLKVDIGASVDVLEYEPNCDSTERIRAGIDFFTYALSTNSEGLRLQIDAVDGYFGGHITYRNELTALSRLTLRLRLLHISAHFLDGHFDKSAQTWKDNRQPIPFTRDFGELVGMYADMIAPVHVQVYAGFSYATLIRPTTIKRVEMLGGIELYTPDIVAQVFDKPCNLYLAQHFFLRGIPNYVGTGNTEFGIKLGEWARTGLRIYLSYYNGLDVFSQYYDVRRESWGIGFAFDFW